MRLPPENIDFATFFNVLAQVRYSPLDQIWTNGDIWDIRRLTETYGKSLPRNISMEESGRSYKYPPHIIHKLSKQILQMN